MKVPPRKDCTEAYRQIGANPMSFEELSRLQAEDAIRKGYDEGSSLRAARDYVAEMFLSVTGGDAAALLREAERMRESCGAGRTADGYWYGYKALFGAADWYLHGRSRGMGDVPVLTNPRESTRDVPQVVINRAVERARAAGAQIPLTFLGIGAYGAVFCDANNFAWKVDYYESPSEEEKQHWINKGGHCHGKTLQFEYEFLKAAGQIPRIENHIIKVYSWHPEQLAMKRECIWGMPGAWAHGGELRELHEHIEAVMLPHGWTAPEYKEDAYVMPHDGSRWVLVDGGLSHRVGRNLVQYVEAILAGREPRCDGWHDLAFYIKREEGVPFGIPSSEVVRVLELMLPRITHSASIDAIQYWINQARENPK